MKMAALSCVLTVLLLSVSNKDAEAAQLTITPPSLTLSGNSSVGTVRFTCAAGTGISQNDLISLVISRVATSGLVTPLGSASTRNNNGGVAKIVDPTIAGATIEGGLTQQSITFTMTETTCGKDETTYICTSTSFQPGDITITAEDRKNFTVDVTAGSVSMTQEPLERSYRVNDTLIMRCNGLVGSNLPSIKIDWVWQYKDRTGFYYNEYDRSEDIMTEGMFQDTNNRCQYRQVSTLTRQITLDDDGREYRCFVRRNNLPSDPDAQHLASYTIDAVYEGQLPDTGNTGANTDTAEAAQLTINPPSLTLSGNSSTGNVRFACTAAADVAQNNLISLIISRSATNSVGQPKQLVSVSLRNNNGGLAKMDTIITGATVEGSLSQKSVTITMTETTCGADEGTYICTSQAFSSTGTIIITVEDKKNFTVDVTAGTVSMTQDPLETRYLVNDTLTMRCNGLVGSSLPSVKIDWVWQYKDKTGFSYNDYVRSKDIMTEGIFPDTNNKCQYRQVSTLTRQITLEDYQREYRCFVRRNNVPSEPDSQHLDSYIIREVYEGQVPDTGNTHANTDSQVPDTGNTRANTDTTVATGVSSGPIIGGVLTAVAAVVTAGVVVVVVC